MSIEVRPVEYFYCTVRDRPGEAARLLASLADAGVNLLAFNAIPLGLEQIQLVFFPAHGDDLARVAEREGLALDGPHAAVLVRGDDQVGALAAVHARLAEKGIEVSASVGVADGRGGYTAVVYVRPREAELAAASLLG
jgi:predicted amino acid-binding ACT domain protein